ncbi:hypothetical protein [Bacillus niameyensis]|uniref:hypothetical protein n=1 Tax=Bacillus niameyensis TaxID=1522308 RepID=UPI001E595293|nr:hypothetical protein [Bacillus niameyensis]
MRSPQYGNDSGLIVTFSYAITAIRERFTTNRYLSYAITAIRERFRANRYLFICDHRNTGTIQGQSLPFHMRSPQYGNDSEPIVTFSYAVTAIRERFRANRYSDHLLRRFLLVFDLAPV